MKLNDVQAYVLARLQAKASLAAFGAPVVYSHFTDPAVSSTLVDERLRQYGVFIEISEVEAERVPGEAHRGVAADAHFDVLFIESASPAHTPTGNDLRQDVIEAVTVRLSPKDTPAEFQRSETARAEQGYVLNVVSFTLRVTIP